MEHLNFVLCKADQDFWMGEAQKDDGTLYWEYILLYVDDVLCISMDPESILNREIGKYFCVKLGLVGPPKLYLGNKVRKATLDNVAQAWVFSLSQYVQNAVHNVEEYLQKVGKTLPKKETSPLTANYQSEIGISVELEAVMASHYQSLIRILRWIVELG